MLASVFHRSSRYFSPDEESVDEDEGEEEDDEDDAMNGAEWFAIKVWDPLDLYDDFCIVFLRGFASCRGGEKQKKVTKMS